MNLLPKELIIKTSEVNHADWNYRLLLGFIQRMRFRLLISLLSEHKFQRLLEVGYGSGIIMPELIRYCDELYGIDTHRKEKEISEILAKLNIPVRLFHGDVTEMPFENQFFDCVVAISTVEYFEDIDAACREVKRILKQGGFFIIITPGYSRIVDFGFRVMTGKKCKDEYGQRRKALVPKLMEHFTLSRRVVAPFYLSPIMILYRGLKLGIPD